MFQFKEQTFARTTFATINFCLNEHLFEFRFSLYFEELHKWLTYKAETMECIF